MSLTVYPLANGLADASAGGFAENWAVIPQATERADVMELTT